jgi:DNA-binding LacI/PurR family transcriptional regulator
VTGLGVAQQMGFVVPDDLSIVGWDDSLISQVVHPPLTAITRDITEYGVLAARQLLAVIKGASTGDIQTTRGELTPRGSTTRLRRLSSANAAR